MKISFDLDETLFVPETTHKVEPSLPRPFNRMFPERLRQGTIELIRRLREEGYEVWIYTTSNRSVGYIHRLFQAYHVRLDGIINAKTHERVVQRDKPYPMPNKMPNFFQISLHVDDELSVLQNGRKYGFHVLRIGPQDDQWAQKIMDEAKRIKKLEEEMRKQS